jgi:hypothetical protein
MPSRKRLKGKARKAAKKQDSKIQNVTENLGGMNIHGRNNVNNNSNKNNKQSPNHNHLTVDRDAALQNRMNMINNSCSHSDLPPPPPNHVAHKIFQKWIDCLGNTGDEEGATADSLLLLLKTYHYDFLCNDESRMIFRSMLLSHGTRRILSVDDADFDMAKKIAKSITVIEYTYYAHDVDLREQFRDLKCGGPRVVNGFFDKRIYNCTCLKLMRKFVRKNEVAMGFCSHCDTHKAYSTLKVCSRCKFDHYCSEECQLASWPEHKKHCKDWNELRRDFFNQKSSMESKTDDLNVQNDPKRN